MHVFLKYPRPAQKIVFFVNSLPAVSPAVQETQLTCTPRVGVDVPDDPCDLEVCKYIEHNDSIDFTVTFRTRDRLFPGLTVGVELARTSSMAA